MKIVLLYTEGLQAQLMYSELLRDYAADIAAVVEFPAIPHSAKTKKRNKSLLKKLADSSFKYLLFNLFVIHVCRLLGMVRRNTVGHVARRHGIAHRSQRVIDREFLAWLESLNPTLLINSSANILKNDLIVIPKEGVLNFHGAPLPEYRGAANYFWVLVDDLPEVWGTLHRVDEGLDTGGIIACGKTIPIRRGMSVLCLWMQIRLSAYPAFREVLERFKQGDSVSAIEQDEKRAVVRSFPKKEDVRKLYGRGFRLAYAKEVLSVLKLYFRKNSTAQLDDWFVKS